MQNKTKLCDHILDKNQEYCQKCGLEVIKKEIMSMDYIERFQEFWIKIVGKNTIR